MDKQIIFNKVSAHLIKQGRAATGTDELGRVSCMYRGPGGTMCAVGCLIPDSAYTSGLEGATPYDADVQRALPFKVDKFTEDFLGELQDAHDGPLEGEGMIAWANRMIRIANRFNLIVPKQVREIANGNV